MDPDAFQKYSILFTIPQGGTYFFFKNIVLKNAIMSIFLGNAFLVLLLLISTTIWTECKTYILKKLATLSEIDNNLMAKMLNFNILIKEHYEVGYFEVIIIKFNRK